MPWHIDGDSATFEGNAATWSAVVDRVTGGFRLLGRDREPLTVFAFNRNIIVGVVFGRSQMNKSSVRKDFRFLKS